MNPWPAGRGFHSRVATAHHVTGDSPREAIIFFRQFQALILLRRGGAHRHTHHHGAMNGVLFFYEPGRQNAALTPLQCPTCRSIRISKRRKRRAPVQGFKAGLLSGESLRDRTGAAQSRESSRTSMWHPPSRPYSEKNLRKGTAGFRPPAEQACSAVRVPAPRRGR